MNDTLTSIDDRDLDLVAGGGDGLTLSVTVPKPSELIEEGVETVGELAETAANGVNDLLGLFDVSFG